MFREHETSIAWKAGFLAVMVHVLLLGALLFSFNWKAAHTVVSVSEVELWDALPAAKAAKPQQKTPKIKQPEPKPEPEVKPEPEIEEVKPEDEAPKVDIELENKKKKEAEKQKKLAEEKKLAEKKLAEEKQKEAEKLAALQQDMLDDFDPSEMAKAEKLKKLQAEIGSESEKPARAANQGVVNEYMAKIIAKVRGNVNRALCRDGNPELAFKVSLLPNGEFVSGPTLSKSSGSGACDAAVERAIIASEPFPLPTDPDTLSEFRNLNLKFKPNEK